MQVQFIFKTQRQISNFDNKFQNLTPNFEILRKISNFESYLPKTNHEHIK